MEGVRTHPRIIPCDERNRATCKHGPNCEHIGLTEHHLRPRRLLKFAREAQAEEVYQTKLKRVINHPNNVLLAYRCIHDALDGLTSDEPIPEEELDRTLEVWNENTA